MIVGLACTPIASAAHQTILVFGDSLSAGYGLQASQAWPSLLDTRLRAERFDYTVANLSISGETTAGGLARLDAALKQYRPAILILALGANDGLRGLPLKEMRNNLERMLSNAKRSGTRVLLVGMRLPPNYGPYAESFHSSFGELAQTRKIAYLPFLLEPIADKPHFFQADRLHPTAEAQPAILNHLWPSLLPLIKMP